MRRMSVVAGIVGGFLGSWAALLLLGLTGPVHVVTLLLALAAGVALGVVTARREEARRDRLEARRRPAS